MWYMQLSPNIMICMYDSYGPERLSDFPKVTQIVAGPVNLDFKTAKPELFLLHSDVSIYISKPHP